MLPISVKNDSNLRAAALCGPHVFTARQCSQQKRRLRICKDPTMVGSCCPQPYYVNSCAYLLSLGNRVILFFLSIQKIFKECYKIYVRIIFLKTFNKQSFTFRCNQGCGSGYFSTAAASASTLIAFASASTASASTNKKRENDR